MILALGFGAGLARLYMDGSANRLIQRDDPETPASGDIKASFGGDAAVTVIYRSSAPFSPEVLASSDDVIFALKDLGLVSRVVVSLAAVSDLRGEGDDRDTSPLMSYPPDTQAEADRNRANALANEPFANDRLVGEAVGRDGKAAALSAFRESRPRAPRFERRTLAASAVMLWLSAAAVTLTLMTTALRFLTLAQNKIPLIVAFGIAASLSMAIGRVLTVLPTPLAVRFPPVPKGVGRAPSALDRRIEAGLTALAPEHRRATIVGSAALLSLSGVVASRVGVDDDFLTFFDKTLHERLHRPSQEVSGAQPQPKLGPWMDEPNRFLAANAARNSSERALLMRICKGDACAERAVRSQRPCRRSDGAWRRHRRLRRQPQVQG
jgi:hypothetical protein